ncbi:MAG TPA: endo-1,3-alpha-glucanase family glycosylhydrolase [Candidatus Binatia bacterium]|jgi:LysM repeat protein|nr:endo-1,3-alpha-glucanase family glycosylhydrolase [Candidatus Binatia bacterium]
MKHPFHSGRSLLVGSVLLASAVLILVVSPQPLLSAPAEAQGRTGLVLAFYYAWYSPQSFGPGKTAFQPPEPYSSGDVATMQRQVSQAKAAGIDGFVQSWYGPGEPVTNGNFQTLLDVAAASGFKAAIDFEPATALSSHEERAAALQSLLATHANHPAYLRVDGKPVVFFWANWAYSVDDWAYIRSIADPNHNSIWIAEGARPEYLQVFDGLHLYSIAWSANPNGIASTWAANTRAASETYGAYKYWVATAMPGFDDRHLGRGEASVYRDRAGGAYYQNSFASAAASNPDMLIITSFNEWAEGSNIEPSISFGNIYLDLTAQLVAGYRSGGVAPPPPLPEPTSNPVASGGDGDAKEDEETNPALAQDATSTPPPEATSSASPTPGADGQIIYKVVAGDTLSAIAVRFDLSLDELYAMNELNADSVLSIGQPILLGIAGDDAAIGNATPTLPPGVQLGDDGQFVYQVVEGDTLIGIAVQHDLTMEQLLALNPTLREDSLLQLGQDVVVGQRQQPESVGGSTDFPEGTSVAVTSPAVPVLEPTQVAVPSATPIGEAASPTPGAVMVEDLTPIQQNIPGEEQATQPEAPDTDVPQQTMPAWLQVVIAFVLVAGIGGAVLFYLGARRSKER